MAAPLMGWLGAPSLLCLWAAAGLFTPAGALRRLPLGPGGAGVPEDEDLALEYIDLAPDDIDLAPDDLNLASGQLDIGLDSNSLEDSSQGIVDATLDETYSLLRGSHHTRLGPELGYYDGNTPPIERLGLPALKMQHGSNGFRTMMPRTEGTTTAWPCGLALASTWDEDVVKRVATAMGREFSGKGANVMLGPSLNVHRAAQAGRAFEQLSGEDPYLGSRLVGPFVEGVQDQGVMCAAKRFGFSDQETNRVNGSAYVDARTAWELYYPPFEAAVRAGIGAFICPNGQVNGSYACHSENLLRRDLRNAMGFRGMVLSERAAVKSAHALEAGVDQEMPGDRGRFTPQNLAQLEPVALQLAAVRVRTAILQAGLDNTTCVPPHCTEQLLSDQTSEEHSRLAFKAAASAVTLLKNEGNVLPLDPTRVQRLAVLGSAAFSTALMGDQRSDYYSGGGSAHVIPKDLKTTLEAIEWRAGGLGVDVLTIRAPNVEAMTRLDQVANADVIVIVAGATSAEMHDRTSLSLDDSADDLIRAVGQLRTPAVVLMQTPGAVLTPWRDEIHVRGIANLFLGGEETGNAWAAVLFGDEEPGGRLPIMLPATADDVVPVGRELRMPYGEGLFTSYRSQTFRAAFPFGHGLSYTSFQIQDPWEVTTGCAGKVCVGTAVANVGRREGAEVVQAYVMFAPGIGEPNLVLRGFWKGWLLPGQSKNVSFSFTARDLSIYQPGRGWDLQGAVQVYVGHSSKRLYAPVLVSIP